MGRGNKSKKKSSSVSPIKSMDSTPPRNTDATISAPSSVTSTRSICKRRMQDISPNTEVNGNEKMQKTIAAGGYSGDAIASPMTRLAVNETQELMNIDLFEDELLNGSDIEGQVNYNPKAFPIISEQSHAHELKEMQEANRKLEYELIKMKFALENANSNPLVVPSTSNISTPDNLRNNGNSSEDSEDEVLEEDGGQDIKLVIRPLDYPNAVISDDMMKKMEVIINGLFKKGSGKFSMKGVVIEACKYGAIFLNCRNWEESDRLTALVESINWERHGLPDMMCGSPSGMELANVLELWIPAKGENFEDAKLMVNRVAKVSTESWKLIKRTDAAGRKGMVFVFATDKKLAERVSEMGPLRFKYGFFQARAVIATPRSYAVNLGVETNGGGNDGEDEDERVIREAMRKAKAARLQRQNPHNI